MCMCMWQHGCHSSGLLFWDRVFLNGQELNRLRWLVSKPQQPYFCIPSTGIRIVWHNTYLLKCGLWGLNSGPHICKASTFINWTIFSARKVSFETGLKLLLDSLFSNIPQNVLEPLSINIGQGKFFLATSRALLNLTLHFSTSFTSRAIDISGIRIFPNWKGFAPLLSEAFTTVLLLCFCWFDTC